MSAAGEEAVTHDKLHAITDNHKIGVTTGMMWLVGVVIWWVGGAC